MLQYSGTRLKKAVEITCMHSKPLFFPIIDKLLLRSCNLFNYGIFIYGIYGIYGIFILFI